MKIKFLLLTFILSCGQVSADEIKLVSDYWCPFACEPNSEKPGGMIEIANAVFKNKGHTVKYEMINWARGIKDTRAGRFDGIIGASRADVKGFIIPQVPVGYLENYFWTVPSHHWKYENKNSLQNVKVGVINDYSYGSEIDFEVKHKNPSIVVISGNDPLARLIQMTETKRLDGFIENPMVLNHALFKMNKSPDTFRAVSKNLADDPELFIAFSPNKSNSKAFAQMLDEGIVELRKNGKLKEILEKYGLKDWEKK